MKNTYFVIGIVLVLVIGFLWYDRNRKNKAILANPDSTEATKTLLEQLTSKTTTIDDGKMKVNITGFVKGENVNVKNGAAIRNVSSPHAITRNTTSVEKWTLEEDPFEKTISKYGGYWVIITKSVVDFGGLSLIPALRPMVKIYAITHISNITKA
jgi:hypothetical protein